VGRQNVPWRSGAASRRNNPKFQYMAETEVERQEAIALRKRIKELEIKIEILNRITAYWTKEAEQ
jgi:hypothetical protein